MKKKIFITFMTAILICSLLSTTAFADTHNVHDGETFNLNTTTSGDIVEIDAGATATLTGTAPESVRVECGSGVNLTINDVILDCSNSNNYCPLKFTGGNNFLTLEGVSDIKGGNDASAIGVPEGAKLTINGQGKINSTAKGWGAGIGSACDLEAGTIIINSGTIEVNSSGGAGIGSGVNRGYEEITINGGTIRVNSGSGACIGAGMTSFNFGTIYINGGDIEVNNTNNGAGIGGGNWSNREGTIVISGGTIRANASSGAGIGSGVGGNAWHVTISGGTIFANSNEGAGIGGGKWVDAGSIQISGGEVYASSNNAHDIGAGVGKTGGTLSISGDAVVFLANEQAGSFIPNTTTHFYYDYANSSEVPAKYSVPATWSYPIGLYRPIEVSVSPETATLGFGETVTLTATTDPAGYPIAFYSSDLFVADVDPATGEVTAGMKEGRVVITAQSTSGYDQCIVYIVDKTEPAPKPSDPLNTISVGIKDDSGNPLAGVYVSLFSVPQTVITDSNGMAVFRNIPYNTNDPHTLIVQDFRGSEIGRYSLNFTSGTSASTSIEEGSINITFDNKVNNTNIALTMVEDRIDQVMVSLGFKPEKVERVENPQTGYYD